MQTNHNSRHFRTFIIREDETEIFGTHAAKLISQIRYWTDPTRSQNYKEDRYWVYNSLLDWQEQFSDISESTLKRIFKKLEDMGVLIVRKFNAWRRDQRKWHSIDFEKLAEILQSFTFKSSRRKRYQKEKEVKNRRNLDLVKMTQSTLGQNDQMSKDTKITQKNTSPTPQIQNIDQDPVREMITIWNKNIEEQADSNQLTYWRRRTLLKTLKYSFQNDLGLWEKYCQHIAHNTFLMGGGPNHWKVSLDWALKPQNIQKVQGNTYTGQKEIPKPLPVFSKESLQGSEVWKMMAALLVERLGIVTFNAWLADGCLQEEDSEQPVLSLGTSFKASYVQQRFSSVIEGVAKEVQPHIEGIRFER